MDTKKIQDKGRHNQERWDTLFIASNAIPAAQLNHGRGRLLCGNWNKANAALPIRQDFDDLVIPPLPFSRISRPALGKRMQSTNHVGGHR